MSYWLLPMIWKYAKDNNLMSQSDFFVSKYNSPNLGVLVALVAVCGDYSLSGTAIKRIRPDCIFIFVWFYFFNRSDLDWSYFCHRLCDGLRYSRISVDGCFNTFSQKSPSSTK